MKIAKRSDAIAPFYVMELLEKAKELEAKGKDIVHMEVGEPDFPTPFVVKEEAIQSIRDNRFRTLREPRRGGQAPRR